MGKVAAFALCVFVGVECKSKLTFRPFGKLRAGQTQGAFYVG
jgi:hypothetical protein